tara:strand:- start:215 stop:457 length:243 start_codon:yes stop_codon:yes gene_type:complete
MKGKLSIYYDEEGDFLEIMMGEPKRDYGEHISEDVVLFKDEETDEVIGIGIFNFKSRTKNLDEINLNLPINISLESLKNL